MPHYLKTKLLVASARELVRKANKQPVQIKNYRLLSNDAYHANLKYVKHAFPISEAIQRISEADEARLFAPIRINSSTVTITDPDNYPLKKVLLPMFGINASISNTHYKGEYGIDRTVITTDHEGKTSSRTVTDWYDINAQLGSCNYGQEYSQNMSIYAGSTYHHRAIEEALERHIIHHKLLDFDASKIDRDIIIDPFDKKDAYARDKANERVCAAEYRRAETDIRRRLTCDHVKVHSISINGTTKLSKNILPAYVLKYDGLPPRVLAAIDEDDKLVMGPAPTSNIKVMATATTVAGLLTLLLPPQISIPARLMFVAISGVLSGIWSEHKLQAQDIVQEINRKKLKEANESVAATHMDEERFKATSRDFILQNAHRLNIEGEFYKVLGLKPGVLITDEILRDAVAKKLHQVHADKGGSDEATKKVLEARAKFNQALHPRSDAKRFFSTYSSPSKQVELKEPPRSVFYPNTGKLITAVLDEKNYSKALQMVMNEEVHPDGHDAGENTLLTEAVKRKDAEAVRFALKDLKCSPDTSCDCPLHNTAIHYAAAGGSSEIIRLLIQYGARVNLINSKGQTPLDMATHETTKKLLISVGAVPHTSRPGINGLLTQIHGFFGYSPDKRTLLEKRESRLAILSEEKQERVQKHFK